MSASRYAADLSYASAKATEAAASEASGASSRIPSYDQQRRVLNTSRARPSAALGPVDNLPWKRHWPPTRLDPHCARVCPADYARRRRAAPFAAEQSRCRKIPLSLRAGPPHGAGEAIRRDSRATDAAMAGLERCLRRAKLVEAARASSSKLERAPAAQRPALARHLAIAWPTTSHR
jgi:hypothetical protein